MATAPATPSTDYIANLPVEIISLIVDFASPSNHLNFARSCKRIYHCSKDVLKAHRKAHEDYATCSDVLPTTIPDLLRRFVADPIAAWHLRTLELYW